MTQRDVNSTEQGMKGAIKKLGAARRRKALRVVGK